MTNSLSINRTALAVSLALMSASAVAAPSNFTVKTSAAPGANVTEIYNHNAYLDCDRDCYGYYITEFPSMNDAGVVAGRLPVSAYVPLKPPIYEPAVKGSGQASNGVAAVWENGVAKPLTFPLVFRSPRPDYYYLFKNGALAGTRIYEFRGCRDYNWDGSADSSTCGSRATAINNSGIVGGGSHDFPAMDTSYFERAYLWGRDFANRSTAPYSKVSPLWTSATVYPDASGFGAAQQDTVTAINNSGSMVGAGIHATEKIRAGFFRLSDDTSGIIGQVLRNPANYYDIWGVQKATALGINDNDRITGGAQQPNADGRTFGNTTAYIYKFTTDAAGKKIGAVASWGAYPGSSMTEGYGININDLVVGRYAKVLSGGTLVNRGFYWDGKAATFTMSDIGDLDGNSTKDSYTVARSVNNKGNIVGTTLDAAGANRGFIYIYAEKKMYDLNAYISNVQTGWTIVDAYTINEKGEVLVRAKSTGGSKYWVLRPNGIDQPANIASAELVSPNSTVSAAIGSAGDNDYFKIELPTDGALAIYTQGSTNTYCHLLSSTGAQLTTNDNISATNTNCSISGYRPAGTYYARIRNASSTGTGSYAFRSTFVAEDGDVKDAGTQVAPVSTAVAKIDAAGDVDFFTVYLDAAKTVKVTTTGTTNTYCALQSTDGSVLAFNDNASSTNTNCSLSFTLQDPGIYHVMVRHVTGTGTGAYSLVLQ